MKRGLVVAVILAGMPGGCRRRYGVCGASMKAARAPAVVGRCNRVRLKAELAEASRDP